MTNNNEHGVSSLLDLYVAEVAAHNTALDDALFLEHNRIAADKGQLDRQLEAVTSLWALTQGERQ
jgi:hypothetical protein